MSLRACGCGAKEEREASDQAQVQKHRIHPTENAFAHAACGEALGDPEDLGLVYAMLGIVGGATAAFFVGRTLARSWVERRIAGSEHLLALDEVLDEQAFTIVALTRIALVFPFNILNYAYGVTRVSTVMYTAGTAAGMLPIVAAYVYLGTLARDMGQIFSGRANIGSGAWWVAGIAAVAIVAVVLTVRRALRRALKQRNRESEHT